MIIHTHHTKIISPNGTSLQGQVRGVSFDRLVALFGTPMAGYDDHKTDAEWALEIELPNGEKHVATIYNWKNGKNYLGQHGLEKDEITEWNIGAKKRKVAELIENILKVF